MNDFFDNNVNNFEPCVIVLANIKRERNTKDCVNSKHPKELEHIYNRTVHVSSDNKRKRLHKHP